jgi:type I restriction enzyme, S subunit
MKIPLSPIPEQHRIVAKVDELMALCDRLEAAQAERESRRDRVAAASLHRLNNGADHEEFREHARFHLRHLPRLTTRVEHIQKLRDTILQLAVTGKLSEQRPNDGDGQTLLNCLNRKRRRVRSGSVHDESKSPEPFPPLPKTWTWGIIDQVAADDDNAITDGPFGANLKTAHYIGTPGYRVIRLQNIGRGQFRTEHQSYIDKERFERLGKHHVFAGDLVVAGLVDPLVRCSEVPQDIGPALVKADCYRFKVHPNYSSRFALHYLNSPLCQLFAAAHHHGMTLVRIGLGNFRLIPIPVPPLAEQHRIVAKVEELMALCDRLEAQLTITQSESRRLLEAVLHEALNGKVDLQERETRAGRSSV